MPELNLELQDTQWPKNYIDHDRQIVRAIVVDDQQKYYFVRVQRDDDFVRVSSLKHLVAELKQAKT